MDIDGYNLYEGNWVFVVWKWVWLEDLDSRASTPESLHSVNILSVANEKLENGEIVPVKLYPEPDNPVDSKAIAFMCLIANSVWERNGYVVMEVLDEFYEAMSRGK